MKERDKHLMRPTVRGWALALAVAGGLVVTIATSTAQTELFRDQMNNGAGWGINVSGTDYAYAFDYDYSANGIPEAPHTRGGDAATRGVKMEVNIVAPVSADFFTLYPMGQSFSGSYQLRFDAWMDYGTGNTTEFLGGGIGYNGTSADVNSGAQFIVTGDGGSAADYRSLTNGGYMSTAAWYPAGSLNNSATYYTAFLPSVNGSVAGAPGKQWVTWEFNVTGNNVSIYLEKPNGARLLLISYAVQPGVAPTTDGNISLFYADFFNSVATPAGSAFGLIDNVVVSNLPPAVTVAATSANASETGTTPAVFTLTRTFAGSQLTVNLNWSGTAQNGVDYTNAAGAALPTTVTFDTSDTITNITVIPVDDTEREPTETVMLTLATGTGYLLGAPSAASATILDNDAVLAYWDADGATPGAGGGGMPAGTWGVDNFWSSSAAGDAATGPWTDWDTAVFSAGGDAAGVFSVTNNGAQKADYLSFEEGIVSLEGTGSLTLTNFDGIKVVDRALIQCVLDGAAGLTLDGPGNLVLAGANTYSGPTKINAGTLAVGADGGVIPDGSAVTIGAGKTLTLDDQLFGSGSHDETIGSLNGLAGSQVNVPAGYTLTFGGDNTDMLWDGTTTGGGLLAKVGTGILNIGNSGVIADSLAISNGVLEINSFGDLGSTASTPLYLDGGTLRRDAGVDFLIPPLRNIIIGAAGGTMELTAPAGANVFLYGSTAENGAGTIQGGVLTCQGPGEFRTYFNHNTFSQLIVKDGFWFTIGQSVYLGYDDSFGAVPSVETADAIKLVNGGQIRKAGGQNLFLNPNRGITLDGGGVIRAYGGDNNVGTFGIASRITGTGPLTLNATVDAAFGPPILLLLTNNTYSGGTVVASSSVYALNTVGSATSSGSVTVNSGATLGGNGTIGGPVTVNSGGVLAAGYSYNTGPTGSVVAVSQPIAKLTLTNGLDLSAGGTNAWQLNALTTSGPGTSYDQVELTGGNLTLGGSSVLQIGLVGIPGPTNVWTDPFWQQNRTWTQVIKFGGGGAMLGNFSSVRGTSGWTGGSFATTTSASGVDLVYTTAYVAPTPVTSTSASVSGGNVTINYTGGAGNQFVLLRSVNVDALLNTWARVATNFVGTGSFVLPLGLDPKAFYSIQSE